MHRKGNITDVSIGLKQSARDTEIILAQKGLNKNIATLTATH